MTWRNRETLRNYFGDGTLPTQAHFTDLIDSMLNMVDEGFRKTVANGQELYAPVGHHNLLSFYRDQDPQQALWRVSLGPQLNQLQFQPQGTSQPLLSLDAQQRVGIGTANPQTTLDVRGTVGSQGRRGTLPLPKEPLKANGEWQDLTGDLEGCQAFEVMAGAGLRGTGHFGLLHATALSAYNPGGWFARWHTRRGIRQTQAWWGRRCDKLQLRWHGTHGRDAKYRLQIRTGCNFGDQVRIQAQLTRLWFDPHMDQGLTPNATKAAP
jgi:hypothetical protein